MTYDELIAAGIWSDTMLEIRSRMAAYQVDGIRFGTLEMTTRSGSDNDVYLEKRVSESTTAALILSRAGFERVELTTVGIDGIPLERPDLDARLRDGTYVGIEVAEVTETALGKHNAGMNLIEVATRDLLDRDQSFRSAFGDYYFAVMLNGVGYLGNAQLSGKKEARAVANEVASSFELANT